MDTIEGRQLVADPRWPPRPFGATPELAWPNVPWSFSALSTFENCPKQYGDVNVKKLFPFVESDAIKNGKEVHKLLEEFVALNRPLPPGLVGIGGIITKMCEGAVEIQAEQKINLTWYLRPCGTFDDDTCYRGVIDLTIIRRDLQAIVVDYKTSSEPREDFEQLEYSALALMQKYPDLTKCHCYYLYTKGHKPRKTVVARSDIPTMVQAMLPRLQRLKIARDQKLFPATPYYGCKWCSVITCPHNPKRN